MYKVRVDKELCIGCGACTSCELFEIGDDGKAFPVKEKVEEDSCAKDGEEICPVGAIKVTKE